MYGAINPIWKGAIFEVVTWICIVLRSCCLIKLTTDSGSIRSVMLYEAALSAINQIDQDKSCCKTIKY